MARVALVYNLIHPEMLRDRPLDMIAELDSEPTIRALADALRAGNHQVVRIEADENVVARLRAEKPEIVFNIAEGERGESRESHIPAICEHLGIPYTGSGVLSTALCLDKAKTKEILLQNGLHTPRFQVFARADAPMDARLKYPLIVKLAHEGSSMGLSLDSIVDDEAALRRRIAWVIETYQQSALVEEFIQGREFTVGVLGNREPITLPIVEITFSHPRGINLFLPDDPVIEMATVTTGKTPATQQRLHFPVIPAAVDDALGERIRETARRAFRALACRDWCRLEMRLGADDHLYLLELNPIAGIDPDYLLPRAANAAGISYADLVNNILNYAMERAGLLR